MLKKTIRELVKYAAYKVYLPLVYQYYTRRPIDEKLVIFAGDYRVDTPDNFVPLIKQCKRAGYHCVEFKTEILSPQYTGTTMLSALKNCTAFMKMYAQCRVLFLTDYLVVSDLVKLREGTRVVQLWHACGLCKKWGYATEKESWGATETEQERYRMYKNLTFVTVSSGDQEIRKAYAAAFNCDLGIVHPLGVPRTDIYYDKQNCQMLKNKVTEKISEIRGKKAILFAPTFRGTSLKDAHYFADLNLSELAETLGNEYTILLKIHPKAENAQIEGVDGKRIINVSRMLTTEEALCAADYLITDYSSILFEYMLLDKPIISYIPDLEEYRKERGFFLSFDEITPGPMAYTQEQLADLIKTSGNWFHKEYYAQYKERFMNACDGHSTERIFKAVFKGEQHIMS